MSVNSTQKQAIETYLSALAAQLAGQDPALIQDALVDAKQHLLDACEEAGQGGNIEQIISDYGDVETIAAFYCDVEDKVNFAFSNSAKANTEQKKAPIYTVLKDAKAYYALLFSVLSLPLSIAYFAWTVMVGAVSLSASLVVVGIPFFLFFLKSMQYFSLFEGRLIETLLYVRMPRRLTFPESSKPTSLKLKALGLLTKPQHWTAIVYLVLKLPIAMVNLFLAAIPFIGSVALILSPIVDPLLNYLDPSLTIDINWYWLPVTLPIGVVGVMVSLTIAKWLTAKQAGLAKYLLVKAPLS